MSRRQIWWDQRALPGQKSSMGDIRRWGGHWGQTHDQLFCFLGSKMISLRKAFIKKHSGTRTLVAPKNSGKTTTWKRGAVGNWADKWIEKSFALSFVGDEKGKKEPCFLVPSRLLYHTMYYCLIGYVLFVSLTS